MVLIKPYGIFRYFAGNEELDSTRKCKQSEIIQEYYSKNAVEYHPCSSQGLRVHSYYAFKRGKSYYFYYFIENSKRISWYNQLQIISELLFLLSKLKSCSECFHGSFKAMIHSEISVHQSYTYMFLSIVASLQYQ